MRTKKEPKQYKNKTKAPFRLAPNKNETASRAENAPNKTEKLHMVSKNYLLRKTRTSMGSHASRGAMRVEEPCE